jgi:hypothetical protein
LRYPAGPMAIRVPGRSQRSTATRSLGRSDTQPPVGPLVCWCSASEWAEWGESEAGLGSGWGEELNRGEELGSAWGVGWGRDRRGQLRRGVWVGVWTTPRISARRSATLPHRGTRPGPGGSGAAPGGSGGSEWVGRGGGGCVAAGGMLWTR